MSKFDLLLNEIDEKIYNFLQEVGATEVEADNCGLDARAGMIIVCPEEGFIAVEGPNSLEYYGGFEYVRREHVCHIGSYTFYFNNSARVEDAIEFYVNKYYEQNEEGE